MRNLARIVSVIGFVAVLLFLLPSAAAWSHWGANGVPVCTAPGTQTYPEIVSDGSDGAIIGWGDDYGGFVQRVNAGGAVQWGVNGVALTTGESSGPKMISDGAGGAIVTYYVPSTDSTGCIYAQRVNTSGAVQWRAGGVALCTAQEISGSQIVSDGIGGAIVTWSHSFTYYGDHSAIRTQRVNASGVVQWRMDGVLAIEAGYRTNSLAIISDGAGGAIVACQLVGYRIIAQRLNASGAVQWGTGVTLNRDVSDNPTITSDGAGGAIIAWQHGYTGYFDIYAQRVNAGGALQWTTNGVALCSATGDQQNPAIVSDGAGGAFVTWCDGRDGRHDIYVQRVNAWGEVPSPWRTDGVPLCTAALEMPYEDPPYPTIVSDGAGGAIVTWEDNRNYLQEGDIYAQRIDASGYIPVAWIYNGVALCTSIGEEQYPMIASDGAGGAIVTWQSGHTGSNIYAQRVDRNGFWGYPSPLITAVADVPSDQGGFINLSWNRSRLDSLPDALISRYTLWRAISHPSAERLSQNGAVVLEDLSDIDRLLDVATGPVIRVEQAGAYSYYWEFLSSVTATHASSYSTVAPTLFDGYGAIPGYHYFEVIAHTTRPDQFWISPPDSGRSLDNLAPLTPTGLAGDQEFSPPGISLTWNPNIEADLGCYDVYRGTRPNFIPGASNLIATPTVPAYLDNGWTGSQVYYYKVSARDAHMNESGFALLSPDQVTDVETSKVPAATYLAQNFPNPFNPMTRIEFGLKEGARVSLRIYDTAGRLVRVLVDDERRAGRYAETWDGRDMSGRTVSSGIYFYRLSAGSFEKSRKMALMR